MDKDYGYLTERNYELKIQHDARICFGFDLDCIRHYIKNDMNGVVTRDWVWDKIEEWKNYKQNSKHETTGFKRIIEKILKKKEIKRPFSDRKILRLMKGLMDLMKLDELRTEYIEEFQKYEDDFYEPFRGIYEGISRARYPFSRYIDNDTYINY